MAEKTPEQKPFRENGTRQPGQVYGESDGPERTAGREVSGREGPRRIEPGKYYTAAADRRPEDPRTERGALGAGYPRDQEAESWRRDYETRGQIGMGLREGPSRRRDAQDDRGRSDRDAGWRESGRYAQNRGGYEGWGTDFARPEGGRSASRRDEGEFEHGRRSFGDYGVPAETQGREVHQDLNDRDFGGRDDRYAGRSGQSFHPEAMDTNQRQWRTPEEEWERTHYRGRPEERRGRLWDREATTAREVMTANPRAVKPEATLREVAQIMMDENCGIVPVCDVRGQLLGVITDRDIVMRTLKDDRPWTQWRADDVMSDEIECVTPDNSLEDVIHLMGRKQVRRVPVVDRNDRLLGMISMADVANRADQDEELQHALDRISKRRSFWSRLWSW